VSESTTGAGWYPDPSGQPGLRYWDGGEWTQHSAPRPVPIPSGTDGFAIASFVLGLLLVVPLGIVFGIVALVRIGTSRRGGKGLAIAGIVLSGLWVVGIGGLVGVAAATGTLRGLEPGQVLQSNLEVGDCVEVPSPLAEIPKSFASRHCEDLHNGEVYAVKSLPAGDFPGEDGTRTLVAATCQIELSGFVGGDASKSPLHIVYIFPTARAWSVGTRRYVCIAVDRNEDIRGSMRDSFGGPGSGFGSGSSPSSDPNQFT
jgi:Protein of unknown function (DUF2510)/Domain of unknown function (DUF4190)/Septum formation